MKTLVLDCTIRDGGYINDWGFSQDFVKKAYNAALESGVDIFEIGFLSGDETLPLWRRSPANVVKEIKTSDRMLVSAMLEENTAGMKLGVPAETGIDVLRVALNKDRIVSTLPLLKEYKSNGYQVFIQMMGITGYSDVDILSVINEVESSGVADYINIGDSYGSLLPDETHRIIALMKRNTKLKIGLHPHNNMQMGMANIIAAIDAGADIVDGSMYGMGRGGGNAPMELILSYYGKIYPERFNVLPVLEFIDRNMMKLACEWDWGYSLGGVLSGVYECHPYYTSRLVEKREYTIEQILKTVKIVNQSDVVGFSNKLLSTIIENGFAKSKEDLSDCVSLFVRQNADKVSYSKRHKGRAFVVLGNGFTLKQCHENIARYIAETNAVVLGANNLNGFFTPDYHAFNNQRRFEQYSETISKNSKVLLGPGIDFSRENTNVESIVCYNSSVTPLEIESDVITSNCRSIAILLGAVALVMGASSVAFAGLDGYLQAGSKMFYEEEESKNKEDIMEKHRQNEKYLNELMLCAQKLECEQIGFITATTYKVVGAKENFTSADI